MELIGFIFLFFRLAPFILVSFFTLSSIINVDYKGIIYLVGLLSACFFTLLAGQFLKSIPQMPLNCNTITINGIMGWSNMPFSPTILAFTFFYLLYSIMYPQTLNNDNLVQYNIPTLVFFPILIVGDFMIQWNLDCIKVSMPQDIVEQGILAKIRFYLVDNHFARYVWSLGIGCASGTAYAAILASTKSNTLAWGAQAMGNEVCSAPSQQTFKCNVYKNGQIIAGTKTGTT
jgi:hypothetical protein